MRPVRLEMNGFAAFRDEAVVDFADADFFVLVGATGSGKSTVIDALTFALYGTVPRWNHRSMVMYGLAPTANQGKVALLFDVADQRYLVARELRRTKAGVHVRNARLDRLLDSAATGGIDDEIESVAADSGVTPAVEKLLGLPYEHFCQCVVLPQGEFADFLRAKPADRRTILLRLLGAGLYSDIGQRANNRASLAGARAELLAEQLDEFDDATEEAEQSAAQHESTLRDLVDAVRLEVPRLRTADRQLASAQQQLDRIVAERAALTEIAIPAEATELDAAHAAAAAALTDADAAETRTRQADRLARERLAAAPDRGPLDQALRDHAEFARVEAALPDAERTARQATDALVAAGRESTAAAADVEQARATRDIARNTVADLRAQADRIGDEIALLDAVVTPTGLVELAGRTAAATRTVAETAAALAAAQDLEAAAQDAAAAAAPRGPVEESLRLVLELAEAEDAIAPLAAGHRRASDRRRAADEAVAAAERKRDDARELREHASITHRAAALRSELVTGQACPVCDQVVATLPAAASAPELDTADGAARAVDAVVAATRADQATASAAETQAATRLTAARQLVATLADRLADRPRDPAALRRTLTEIDELHTALQASAKLVRTRRGEHERAVAAATALDADAESARTALRRARDPLVALGAPPLDQSDLLTGWPALADWASAQAATRRSAQRATHLALSAEEESFGTARRAFAAAQERAVVAQAAVNAATAAAERARAVVDGLRSRRSELAAALAHSPSADQATSGLRRIDEMTAAVRDADTALTAATADRAAAATALAALTAEVGRAWRQLRAARDGVIGLGAPDLPDGSVLAGWTTLSAWARAAARSRAEAVPDAQDAVTAATRGRDEIAKHLTDEFAALGVDLGETGPAELADTAPAAAAAALTKAGAERTRITERRARAATLRADLTAAEQDRQVAKMLGNLLRSNQFPEWLESAALDTLVIDASRRLTELSGGQFELTHRDGEFMVVDHADADSIRSVRTLSGGETFQASLALALALSTQLSSMAAEGAARLDSIFLDEGFGTLDEATLEVVAATLENLAQGDRMVGVVTHVGALADRIPVRFRVQRDARTSSIEREAL
jgi:exonuclease SbcC